MDFPEIPAALSDKWLDCQPAGRSDSSLQDFQLFKHLFNLRVRLGFYTEPSSQKYPLSLHRKLQMVLDIFEHIGHHIIREVVI